MKIYISKPESGFTLIEGLIALAIITTGLAAGLVLATANYRASRDNISRVIAANLAREGVEAVRNNRDTNWLRSDLNLIAAGGGHYIWDRIVDSTGAAVTPTFVVNQITPETYSFSKVAIATPNPSTNGCQPLDYMCTCLLAAGDPCKLSFNVPVGYGYPDSLHRLMITQDICWNDTTNSETIAAITSSCQGSDSKVGMLVTGMVKLGEGQAVTVKEKLYNWRE